MPLLVIALTQVQIGITRVGLMDIKVHAIPIATLKEDVMALLVTAIIQALVVHIQVSILVIRHVIIVDYVILKQAAVIILLTILAIMTLNILAMHHVITEEIALLLMVFVLIRLLVAVGPIALVVIMLVVRIKE
jgi:ABC-type transport system involved in multi-copper enzyme maturation permease subunit